MCLHPNTAQNTDVQFIPFAKFNCEVVVSSLPRSLNRGYDSGRIYCCQVVKHRATGEMLAQSTQGKSNKVPIHSSQSSLDTRPYRQTRCECALQGRDYLHAVLQ
jgi:hypothetical protein